MGKNEREKFSTYMKANAMGLFEGKTAWLEQDIDFEDLGGVVLCLAPSNNKENSFIGTINLL